MKKTLASLIQRLDLPDDPVEVVLRGDVPIALRHVGSDEKGKMVSLASHGHLDHLADRRELLDDGFRVHLL